MTYHSPSLLSTRGVSYHPDKECNGCVASCTRVATVSAGIKRTLDWVAETKVRSWADVSTPRDAIEERR